MNLDPNRYGLLVVQAAVRAGAREVRILHRRWTTTFELIGARIHLAALEKLLDHAGAPGPEGAMASAVEMVSKAGPREIRVSCQGRQLRLRGRSRAVLNKGPIDLTLEVDRRPAIVKQVLTSYPHRLEDQPVREQCQLAPLPVSIDETPVRSRFSLKGCLAALVLEAAPNAVDQLPVYLPGKALVERRPSPRSFNAAIGLIADMEQSKTVLVVDGVTVDGPTVPGLRAVLWSSSMKLNPELTAVAEAGPVDRFLDDLMIAQREMNDALWERLPEMSAAQRARAVAYLKERAPDARLKQMQRLLAAESGPSAVLLGIAAERARAEGDLIEAQSYYMKALEHPDAIRKDLLPELIQVMGQLKARPRQVEPYVREIFSGLQSRKVGFQREAMAGYLQQMGRYSEVHGFVVEARGYYAEALTVQEALLGKHHPTVEKLREILDTL